MSRRKAREFAFKVAFQVDQVGAEPQQAFKHLLEVSNLVEKDRGFALELINTTNNSLEEIDEVISQYTSEWNIDRMPAVDRNIMRVAACEILFMENVDPVIVIDEAIEIAKKYGSESSSAYINAILDRIRGAQK